MNKVVVNSFDNYLTSGNLTSIVKVDPKNIIRVAYQKKPSNKLLLKHNGRVIIGALPNGTWSFAFINFTKIPEDISKDFEVRCYNITDFNNNMKKLEQYIMQQLANISIEYLKTINNNANA